MQRPLMNPINLTADPDRGDGPIGRLFNLLFRRNKKFQQVEALMYQGTPLLRIVRGILYRLALVPMISIVASAALVYQRTHPPQPPFTPDPLAVGVYYQSVAMTAEDGKVLDGWLVPALSAQDVILYHDAALFQRRPAVVLAHDFGQECWQMKPLIAPLHEKGWVVLVVGLRGSGTAKPGGQTLGLDEALDIQAGVNLLRQWRPVDPDHIAVVGVGSGANAALLAADRDPQINALVLDNPAETGDDAVAQRLAFNNGWLNWLNPLCRLAFEIGYGVDVRDLDMRHYQAALASRPTLMLHPSDDELEIPDDRVKQIVDFLSNAMPPPPEIKAPKQSQ